jgi:hypothetical protein
MNRILIRKIPGAFSAQLAGYKHTGVGNTWMEAIGSLVAMNLKYNGLVISSIAYDITDPVTTYYVAERSLNIIIAQ